jgi:hypothetical protein
MAIWPGVGSSSPFAGSGAASGSGRHSRKAVVISAGGSGDGSGSGSRNQGAVDGLTGAVYAMFRMRAQFRADTGWPVRVRSADTPRTISELFLFVPLPLVIVLEFLWVLGGRTRTRTLDPLTKSRVPPHIHPSQICTSKPLRPA